MQKLPIGIQTFREIREALQSTNIFWKKRSLQRMLERSISREEVK